LASWSPVLTVVHLVGLAMAVGAATTKLVLLLKCGADPAFLPTYLKVSKPITRNIIIGMILLTLSGIGWLVMGYGFGTLLVVKLILVGAVWVLGPVIDNVVEPRFQKLAPAAGASPSAEFLLVQKQYVTWEVAATGLFYVVIVIWTLR